MARTFDPSDVITLPRLDAAGAVALVHEVLAAAEDVKKLPANIGKAKKKLAAAHEALKTAMKGRLTPQPATEDARKADQAEDAAWSATYDWLLAWIKLAHPHAETARLLREGLFPDGLRFTQLPVKLEWAEAEARLARIAENKLDKSFATLGGEAFLQVLRKVHKEYGLALGMTAPKTAPAPIATIREPLSRAVEGLRAYTLQVVASIDEDDSSTRELADRLLAPLAAWKSRRITGGDPSSDPDDPDNPDNPDNPDDP